MNNIRTVKEKSETMTFLIENDLRKKIQELSFSKHKTQDKKAEKKFQSYSACVNYYIRLGMEKDGVF
ncbi:MAG: hypothetical protein NWE98_02045 [Candidatus Bathyarchaeota archaeon]|nr:hypothetical protein [Candidatus Bathyarchaeota archaeon]